MGHSVLRVQGMSCQQCVKAIEGNVGKLSGVVSVAVNLANAQVDVHFDGHQTTAQDIIAVVTKAGFVVCVPNSV